MRRERRAPFLASLTEAADMGASAQGDRVPVEVGQLRNAQASLDAEQKERVVTAADPRRSVGCGKERVDLGAG